MTIDYHCHCEEAKADVVTEGNACGAISGTAECFKIAPINIEYPKCSMLIG